MGDDGRWWAMTTMAREGDWQVIKRKGDKNSKGNERAFVRLKNKHLKMLKGIQQVSVSIDFSIPQQNSFEIKFIAFIYNFPAQNGLKP